MSEEEQNKNNLLYFECSSMRELYDSMRLWQETNHKRFIALSIQQDGGNFCCIALIPPRKWEQQIQPYTKYEEAMKKFRRKALKHIGVGVDFWDPDIPPEKLLSIKSALEKCTNQTEVIALFAGEF